MNSIEKLRWQIQIALLIEAHKADGSVPDVVELSKLYSIEGNPSHIQSSIKQWEDAGYLISYRTFGGAVGARIKASALSDALSEVLDFLDADTFEVDWSKEEIVTDAVDTSCVTARQGWKLLQLEPEAKPTTRSDLIAQVPQPINITNTFAPINNVNNHDNNPLSSVSWAGWASVILTLVLGAITIAIMKDWL